MSNLSVNMLVIMSSKIITISIAMITGVFVARKLGVDTFGAYSAATILLYFIYMVFDCGFDLSFISLASQSREKTDDYFFNSLLLKSLFILVAFVFVYLGTPYLSYPDNIQQLILLFFIPIILPAINATHLTYLQIHEKFMTIAFLNMCRSILILVFSIVALMISSDIIYLGIAQNMVACIITVMFFLSTQQAKWSFSKMIMIELVREQKPFALSTLLNSFYTRAPLVYMTRIVSPAESGIFEAANKLTNSLRQGISSVDSALIPKLFVSVKSGRIDATNRIIVEVFSFISAVSLFCSISIYFFAEDIIDLLYGPEFIEAAVILKILSLNLLVFSFAPLFGTLISACSLIRQKTVLQLITLVITIVAGCYLIPRYGNIGAAITSTVTSLTLLVIYAVYSRIKLHYRVFPLVKTVVLYSILMSAVYSIYSTVTINTNLHFLIVGMLGAILYISVAVILLKRVSCIGV